MKKQILCIIIMLISSYGFSQSVLWRVSGKNIKSPSYLYGTIHIQDKKVFAFDSVVTNAFNSCEAFAMEILMDEITPEESMKATLMDGDNTISGLMSKEDYAILDSLVKATTGASMIMYNKMKPFFISSAMMQSRIKQEMETALDLYLLGKARKAGKSCYGVEKFQDQIDAIDAISLDDQIKMLLNSIYDTSKNGESAQFDDLLKAYLSFDLETALKMTNDTSLPAEFNKIFLIDRNIGMAKNFYKIAKKQTLFCAIGAAHLPGEKGVIEHLRRKGLTVEPVIFKWLEE